MSEHTTDAPSVASVAREASATTALLERHGEASGSEDTASTSVARVARVPGGFLSGPDPRRCDPHVAARAKRPGRSVHNRVAQILDADHELDKAARAYVDAMQDPGNKLMVAAHQGYNDRNDGPVERKVSHESSSRKLVIVGHASVAKGATGPIPEAVRQDSLPAPLGTSVSSLGPPDADGTGRGVLDDRVAALEAGQAEILKLLRGIVGAK